jgi:hypothetical protein
VGKPIYGSSVGRARNFEEQLAPLREVLEQGVRGQSLNSE